MQKEKTIKSKVKKPTPKAQSVQETGKHEKVVQDRIAGLTVSELMRRHGYSRQAVRDIINTHKERIVEGVKEVLEERQERINKALDEDVQTLAELLTESTVILRKLIKRIHERLTDETPLKDRDLAALADVAVKAMDRVHTVVLNQQKEAVKSN